MTKEEFENIIRPLVLLPRDQSKLLKQTLLKNFEKWQKKAINYSRCCETFKDEKKMNFGDWKFSQGLRYVSDHTYKNAKGELFDADVVNKNYDNYYNL